MRVHERELDAEAIVRATIETLVFTEGMRSAKGLLEARESTDPDRRKRARRILASKVRDTLDYMRIVGMR